MRNTVVTLVAMSTLVAAMVGMPGSAQSQVVVIIGNGHGQPYYPPPYPYPYPPVVYGEPSLYPAYRPPAYVNGYNNGGYNNGGYYNGLSTVCVRARGPQPIGSSSRIDPPRLVLNPIHAFFEVAQAVPP